MIRCFATEGDLYHDHDAVISVGKTSLLRQFVNNEATANVDILTKRIYVEDQALTLQVRSLRYTFVLCSCSLRNLMTHKFHEYTNHDFCDFATMFHIKNDRNCVSL